jgi:two-component system, NtrC family, sensor histidine kinase KinB
MRKKNSGQAFIIVPFGALLLLLAVNVTRPFGGSDALAPTLLFALMLALATNVGLPLSADYVSVDHVVALAALLALDLTPALWSVVLGTALAEAARYLLTGRTAFINSLPACRLPPDAWWSAAIDAGTRVLGLGIAALIYLAVGGRVATLAWTWRDGVALVTLLGSYFLSYHTLQAWILYARGEPVALHFQRHLQRILVFQLLLLPLAVILSRIYLGTTFWVFAVLGILLSVLWILSCWLFEMRRGLSKRLRELGTLNKIGRAIATSLELDALLDTLYYQVSQFMEADYFYIALYNEVTNELSFPVVFEDGERKSYSSRRTGKGLTEYVIRQRKPILIPERAEQVIANLGLEMIGEPALSWLGVPMIAGDKVLGVITVQSFSRSHAYDQEEVSILSTMAAQAAIALENVQLYGKMRRRTAELALLNTVSTAVNSTLDLAQVSRIVVTSIMPIMVCQKSALYLLDSTEGRLYLAASQGVSERQSQAWQERLTQEAFETQDLVIVPDVAKSERPAAEIALALQEGDRAFAEIALMAQNELIGVLCIYYDQVHYFDLAERDLLTTFANQAATAISNARLYSLTDQALARRVEELGAIERIGRELTAMLDLQRVINLVLEQAMNATGATHGNIVLLDEEQHLVKVVTHCGYSNDQSCEFLSRSHQPSEGIVGRVLRERHLALVQDVQQDRDYITLDPAVKVQLTVPILRENAVLGAINLESTQEGGFDEQDANFVSQLATQAAIAMQNAQLFEERSQRVEELSLLYQASLALASSLEYQDVLDIISRLTRNITNSDTVTLYLYDSVKDRFERASIQGYSAKDALPSAIRRQGTTRTVIQTGRPILISDTLEHPNINPLVIKRGIRSVIGVPVMSHGEVLGVLLANHRQPNAYTENDVRLVSALANQAGATIANVVLFDQVSQSRDRLQAIINSTREGILVLDNSGRVIIANARIESFSNLRRMQLVGRTVDELLQSYPEELANLWGIKMEELGEYIAQMRAYPEEFKGRAFQISVTREAGGQSTPQTRFSELFSTPVLDEKGQVIGRLQMFRDITEEKELEQMRDDLTGMMVHDLRSPLTSILSGLEMIKSLAIRDDSDPLAGQAMQVAERSCHSMLTLVNSLLDINQLQNGKIPLERAPAPFPPLARSIVSRFSTLAAESGLTLDTDLAPDLPMVNIDNEKVGRVLSNLLDNALKFTPQGGKVTLRAVRQDGELGNVLLCSVSDTGPGVPQEFQEKIFGRFVQIRGQVPPRGTRGTGLGLAFCKIAVEAHEGRIWVESDLGQGSTFYFTLPVADVEAWLDE